MSKRVPVPKKNNIILSVKTNQIKLTEESLSNEVLAIVVAIGEDVKDYEIGDEVLFDQARATEVKYFGDPLWRIKEEYIICGVSNDSL